jgi:SpoVK/Ycf46/Vps4 family AAA+-type ATPase
VLDMYVGRSERNLHDIFEQARRLAPTVLFFDEVDALGARRSGSGSSSLRTTVNQLLSEMDGVDSSNDGVFIVGATNTPWEVDGALRRPGRFDRMILVTPPDLAARAAMFQSILTDRPIAAIDPHRLAQLTEGHSGADIRYVCETAVQAALMDSLQAGLPRVVTMADLETAIRAVRPSVEPWFESARSVVEFANATGEYDELRDYLASRKERR